MIRFSGFKLDMYLKKTKYTSKKKDTHAVDMKISDAISTLLQSINPKSLFLNNFAVFMKCPIVATIMQMISTAIQMSALRNIQETRVIKVC